MNHSKWTIVTVSWCARLALAAGFLSAVADRFGLWGAPGTAGVVWGNWENFASYSATLNFWAPAWCQSLIAGIATVAEVVLGIGLLVPRISRFAAIGSGLLLLAFGLSMIISGAVKGVFDYSVFSAAAAAFLLAQAPASVPELP